MDILLKPKTDYSKVEFNDPQYSYQKNTAIVRFDFLATMQEPEKASVVLNLKVVMVLVKNKGQWQILLRQGYRIPSKT